jgi:hypothetical protein
VVATDQGFDSAWSNFNSDCGATPGPDCVQAQPLNLDPPAAPVGLTATDAETGGRLDLSWVPNAEVDIWSYEVHYGTTPSYGSTKTVLGDHETSLTGLQDGATYYVAIQATNTSGTASPLSDPPVTAVPTMVLGVKAPDWISDLRLAKSSSDALLSWTPVTHDIYGKPVAVAHYEILRGVAPVFLPTPEPPHDTTSTAGYSDAGSLAAAEDHFYLVRAVDAEGNPGGLGHQLPAGVVDLEIEPSATTPGALVLGWSPVGTDFDGNPLIVAHYEIWAAAAPFTRAEIEAGMPELVSTGVTSTTVEIFPAGPKRYYSVLAVDARGNRSPF